MSIVRSLLFLALFATSSISFAAPADEIPGCQDFLSIESAVYFSATGEDADQAAIDAIEEMRAAFKALCSRFTPQAGATVYYSNGKTATTNARIAGATWYYSNGKTITTNAGIAGATWYYPNGKTITTNMGIDGATWYYPNGKTITTNMGIPGATWYYANGRTITTNVGIQGATWYYPNGKTISTNMGIAGATWYYANGRTWTTSGVELSEEELMNPFGLLRELIDAGATGDED